MRQGAVIGRAKKIRLTDKVGALTLLMRHLGLLNDKLKVQGDMENLLLLLIQSIQGSALKPVPTSVLPRPYGDA